MRGVLISQIASMQYHYTGRVPLLYHFFPTSKHNQFRYSINSESPEGPYNKSKPDHTKETDRYCKETFTLQLNDLSKYGKMISLFYKKKKPCPFFCG